MQSRSVSFFQSLMQSFKLSSSQKHKLEQDNFAVETKDTVLASSDVLKSEEGLDITPVRQRDYVKKGERGFCGGLSIKHIKEELKSTDGKPYNPFADLRGVSESMDIQKSCQEDKIPFQCFASVIKKDTSGEVKLKYVGESENLENKISKTLDKSMQNHEARGLYVGMEINKSEVTSKPQTVRHATSLVVREFDGEPLCSGMDANSFFVSGKGKENCQKIAKKMLDNVNAYEGQNIRVIAASRKLK